jgi:hypothetical protein
MALNTYKPEYNITGGTTGGLPSAPGPTPLNLPKYDYGKLAGLQQEFMAPGTAGLQREVRNIASRRYASPIERRQAIRGGIRGYGEALPGIQAGALQQAAGIYAPEYERQVAEAQSLAEQRRQQEMLDYQAALEEARRERQREEIETQQATQQSSDIYDPLVPIGLHQSRAYGGRRFVRRSELPGATGGQPFTTSYYLQQQIDRTQPTQQAITGTPYSTPSWAR